MTKLKKMTLLEVILEMAKGLYHVDAISEEQLEEFKVACKPRKLSKNKRITKSS